MPRQKQNIPLRLPGTLRRERIERRKAIHESGHAIVSYFLGYRIRRPTLSVDGHSTLPFEKITANEHDIKSIRSAETVILICYAGPFAERKFAPKSKWEMAGVTDLAIAERLLREIAGGLEWFRSRHEVWLRHRAQWLVDQYWREINFLADDLFQHRKLGKDGVRIAVARSIGMTPREIREALAA